MVWQESFHAQVILSEKYQERPQAGRPIGANKVVQASPMTEMGMRNNQANKGYIHSYPRLVSR